MKTIIEKQLELMKMVYPEGLDPAKKAEATNNMVLGIQGELAELMEGYKALPWKPEREETEYILEEITDLLHFVLELYIIWGVTDWVEVEARYTTKNRKNHTRGKVHMTHSNDLD